MFHRLVNHNKDLSRLVTKGYALTFDSNHLVIRDIPYLNNEKKLCIGGIVSKLVFIDDNKVKQDDHQIFFAGSVPHNLDGQPIPNLGGSPTTLSLSDACVDVVVERSFSNKPFRSGALVDFKDFFEKIESYVAIISGPAIELYDISPYTFNCVKEIKDDSVFKIRDTLTSRAEISDISAKLKDDVVAIIGLGGTGGYVLDFLAKTSVKEIRAFDADKFYVHNVFRAPGKFDKKEFGQAKSEVFNSRYDNLRTGLNIQTKFIDSSSSSELEGVTFAFVCVDKGSSRAEIFDLLISMKIPFIDVGLGLRRKNNSLKGMIRATYYPSDKAEIIRGKKLAELNDEPDDEYKINIQIGELNALNACLAVIRFKQLRGFYIDEMPQYHLLFDLFDLKILGEPSDEI